MANLKRNAIELVTGVNGEEVETKVFYTPPFIPLSVVYEAIDILDQLEPGEDGSLSERESLDALANFIASEVYKGQFTKDELVGGLHAPDAVDELQMQLLFVARGEQSDHSKKLVGKIKK